MPVKVKMLRNQAGCPDGINSVMYRKGDEPDLPSNLARLFLEMGAAELALEKGMMRGSSTPEGDSGEEEELTLEEQKEEEEKADISDKLNVKVVSLMNHKEKAQLKYLVRRLNRTQLEHLVEREELPFKPMPNWKDETVVKRVLEALGL